MLKAMTMDERIAAYADDLSDDMTLPNGMLILLRDIQQERLSGLARNLVPCPHHSNTPPGPCNYCDGTGLIEDLALDPIDDQGNREAAHAEAMAVPEGDGTPKDFGWALAMMLQGKCVESGYITLRIKDDKLQYWVRIPTGAHWDDADKWVSISDIILRTDWEECEDPDGK